MVLAIWQAIRRATRRHVGTLFSFRLNHFFLFVGLMIWGALVSHLPPRSAYPFLLLLFLLILAPLSSDPLAEAPAVRLQIWPLELRQRAVLRGATVLLSPVLWLAILLVLLRSPALALWLAVAAVGSQVVIASVGNLTRQYPRSNLFAFVPALPVRAGILAQNYLRQMLSVLDTYLALALSAGALAYRLLAPHPDAAAFPILSLLVALAMSTGAQCLFALDSAPAITRYRLLPVCGWQVLLAKDAAWLAILVILLLPLQFVPGLTFGMIALAIGHFPSVLRPARQLRWRFLGGRMISGVPQALVAFGLGFAASHGRPWLLAPAAVVWLASLYLAGLCFDRPSFRS